MTEEHDICIPFFHTVAVVDEDATKKNGGVPVFKDQVFVEIRIPGQRDIVDRPAEAKDKTRWPKQWEQYEKGEKQLLDGIPISEWANSTEAERKTVLQLGITTLEQLAGLGDDAAAKSRVLKLKDKAQKFLNSRNNAAAVGKLQVELDDLKKLVTHLQNENAELKQHATDSPLPERNEGNRVHSP